MIWLNAYKTSSDPSVIGAYYLESVNYLEGCPHIVRPDLGTENSTTCTLQGFLRDEDTDAFSGDKKLYVGKKHV